MKKETDKQQEDRIRKFCPNYELLLAYTMATEDSLNRLSEIYLLLNKYSTSGGFIKDVNEKWCKEGDKVEYDQAEWVLQYSDSSLMWRVFCPETGDSTPISTGKISAWKLIEPCEPDVVSIIREYEDNLLKESGCTDEILKTKEKQNENQETTA